jgi:lipoyl(octanoyl) transferase
MTLKNAPVYNIFSKEIEWLISDNPVPYSDAIEFMEQRAFEIHARAAPECIWLLEHPSMYTAGTSADPRELVDPCRFPVYEAKRGGRYTYHGPGQRVAYVMLNLKKRGTDVRKYVQNLENWVIKTLLQFTVTGERHEGQVGIWVRDGAPNNPANSVNKIAAIGVRIRKWVTFHGISINVDPNLSHYDGIVPCGISKHGVTSLWNLGITASLPEVDNALKKSFYEVFGDSHLDQ